MVSGTRQKERIFSPRSISITLGKENLGGRRRRRRKVAGFRRRGRRARPAWAIRAGPDVRGLLGLEDVHAHDLPLGIVQDQVQVVELGDAVQPAGEVVEQFAEAAVVRDGLGDFQQGLLARGGRFVGTFWTATDAWLKDNTRA